MERRGASFKGNIDRSWKCQIFKRCCKWEITRNQDHTVTKKWSLLETSDEVPTRQGEQAKVNVSLVNLLLVIVLQFSFCSFIFLVLPTIRYTTEVGWLEFINHLMEAIKKRLSFGHYPKAALTPPLILDIREVTFLLVHFEQPWGNFFIGPKLKYLPNI